MQKQHHISVAIAAAILIALTLCGSFGDLEIAKALYLGQTPAENPFGTLVAYVGIIPTFVGWGFLGASIFSLAKKQIENPGKRWFLMAFAILLFVLSLFYFCNTLYISNRNAFQLHFAVAYLIGIAVVCTAAYFGYTLSAKSEDSELLKKALILAAVSLVTLLVISNIKDLMCRPRFRFVLAMENMEYFRNWWEGGRDLKMSLAAGTVTDEFASFPSGHSAYSMFAIFIFPALGDYVRRLRNYKSYLFAFGFLWWAVTALSRLTIGAHYLTDVAMAGLIAILIYVVVSAAAGLYCKRKGL